METLNYNFTDSQKESCAVSLMRDAVEELSLQMRCFALPALKYMRHSLTMILVFGEKAQTIF